jgi:hypothetical protein
MPTISLAGAGYCMFVGFFLAIGWAFGSWLIGWVIARIQ